MFEFVCVFTFQYNQWLKGLSSREFELPIIQLKNIVWVIGFTNHPKSVHTFIILFDRSVQNRRKKQNSTNF